jgi:hypothetical protein
MMQATQRAVGEFIGRFFAGLSPTTEDMHEFCARPLAHACVWANGRMVDDVESQLRAWMSNDNEPGARTYKLPVVIVALSNDYTQTAKEINYQVNDMRFIRLPNDPKNRVFGLKTVAADRRMQICIIAQERVTADSIAAQLSQFVSSERNRRFYAGYRFSGVDAGAWPVQIDAPDVYGKSVQVDGAKAPIILTTDFDLHSTLPGIRPGHQGCQGRQARRLARLALARRTSAALSADQSP